MSHYSDREIANMTLEEFAMAFLKAHCTEKDVYDAYVTVRWIKAKELSYDPRDHAK